MSTNKKIIVAALIGVVFGVSSCKKFLNVNTNPNGAKAGTVQSLLPAAELYVGTAQGVDLEIDGSFFAQYWTQSPGASQYHSLDQYSPGQDAFSYAWANLYASAENFYQLYKLADSQKETGYMAISLIMQAYCFQLLTDGFGDVPCTQALKAQYADGHIVNPKYDSQLVVYNTILNYLDSANVLITKTGGVPGSDDLIYQGNMANWQAFSNTLALRVYMRLSAINPAMAQAGIAALYANPTTSTFIGTGQDAFIAYGFNSANESPLYAEEAALQYYQNFVASNTCLDTLMVENDPRVNIFYEPVYGSSPAAFVGLPQGLYNGIPYTGYSFPSVYVAGDAQNLFQTSNYNSGNAPVNFLTSYESLFLQAEVSARGWANPGNDAALFDSAISANFSYYSKQLSDATGSDGPTNFAAYMSGGGYWTTYPAAGSVTQKVKFIIVQKWFAMCGNQGFEAWSEWRRTGYPNWFTMSVSSIIGSASTYVAGVYTPVFYTTGAPYPKRFTYPSTESTVNSSFPGLQPLTAKVWWDLL